MRHTFVRNFFLLVVFILGPFPLCKDCFAYEGGYQLLNYLVPKSTDIISYSGLSVVAKNEAGLTVFEVVVNTVLKGRLRKGMKIRVICQDVMNPKGCETQSPFLFLTPLSPKSATFDQVKSLVAPGRFYRGRLIDGQALTEEDGALLKLFITNMNTPSSMSQKILASNRPFFMASLFALEPNPSLLSEVLKTNSLMDEAAALHSITDNLSRIRGMEEQICQVVRSDFDPTHSNLLNEAELGLIGQLPCRKADFLLQQLASSNEFVVMLATYHLASTDAGTVRKAVQYFKEHPQQITSVEILNQLSFAMYASGACALMKEWLEQHKALLENVPAEISRSEDKFEFLAENYARCLGHLPNSAPLLISLLKEKPLAGWHFADPSGKINFRVLTQVIKAVERQLAMGGLSKETPDLKPALVDQLQNGHPQVVPEIMHVLRKYYPGNETDSLIMSAAMQPTAKKYHQSHAIMAFLEAGQIDKAVQIAQGSQYEMIRQIGEFLISRTVKPSPATLKTLQKTNMTQHPPSTQIAPTQKTGVPQDAKTTIEEAGRFLKGRSK